MLLLAINKQDNTSLASRAGRHTGKRASLRCDRICVHIQGQAIYEFYCRFREALQVAAKRFSSPINLSSPAAEVKAKAKSKAGDVPNFMDMFNVSAGSHDKAAGSLRARSHCPFAPPPIHSTPDL